MEILPGVGVDQVRIGDARDDVEARLGPPVHDGRSRRAVYRTVPAIVVDYARDGTVEVVQVAYCGTPDGDEAYYDGVQLTFRFLDDVVAELTAKGLEGTPSDVGTDFLAGFSLFSMGSLDATALDPGAAGVDDRPVVEGVTIAPYPCLTAVGGTPSPRRSAGRVGRPQTAAAPLPEPPRTGEWGALLAVPPVPVHELRRDQVPTGPGVYLWHRDGEVIHLGMAPSLRGRMWSGHLTTSVSLTSSSLRRTVCELLFGIPTTVTGNPGRAAVTREQAAAVHAWLLDCHLSWHVPADPLDAGALEQRLLREFEPRFNRSPEPAPGPPRP